MQPFDPKTYSKVVLAKYRSSGQPDEFERYLLDLTDDDDDQIEERLEEVRRFWNNSKTLPPPIGPLITALVNEHSKMVAQLGDQLARRALRDQLRERRAREQAERWAGVERALDQLAKRHGGIPVEVRPQIVAIGRDAGLVETEIEQHVDDVMGKRGWKTVQARRITDVVPLDRAKAEQITQLLRRFADTREQELRITQADQPVRFLFEALGLQFEADHRSCGAAISALEEFVRKNVKSSGGFAAAARNVLESARANLGEQMIDRYRATVVNDVKVSLEREFRSRAIDGTIDRDESAELIRLAAAAGLPGEYASAAVDQLFRDSIAAGASVSREVGERAEIILCADCGSPDSLESGHKQCLRCGQPLYRECNNCHKPAPRGEAVCRHCSHSMLPAIQVDMAVRQGRLALSGGWPDQAVHSAATALAINPDSIEAQQLAGESQMLMQKAHAGWRLVREAVEERRLFAARVALQPLLSEAADVLDAGESPAEAQTRLRAEFENIDRRLTAARGESHRAQRERLFAEILDLAADCEEAKRALSQIPPQAPERLEIEIATDSVRLRWEASPSPGVGGYTVVRANGRAAIDPAHGQTLATTKAGAFVDDHVEAGMMVAYSVFALRADSRSTAVTTAPLLTAFEATDVRTSVSSGEVRLSWQLPTPRALVEIERRADDGDRVVLRAGGDGLVDTGVVNGRRYRYLVRVSYGDELTAGVEVVATPAEPPRPVVLLGLDAAANGVAIGWTPPPSGAVTIVRSAKRLELESGTELTRDQVGNLGALLPGSGGSATDPSPVDGVWYTPVTVIGDRAVIGTGLRWSDIPAITEVQARDVGAQVVVSWSWPARVNHAVVVWREDAAPEGLDDPQARRQRVTRAAQQEVSGGVFRIAREQPTLPLRIAVYGAQMRDGELVIGSRLAPSSRTSLDPATARSTISYDVRVSRSFRGRSLDFALEGGSGYPEVVLVAKVGDIIPRSADDGQAVARIGGGGGPAAVSVPIGALPPSRPLAVRAFLAADSAKASYSLREPADLTKLILR
jgi:hypothetical protein